MVFIPNKSIEIEDIVYLSKDVSVLSGMFEKGTKMTIKRYSGYRGWDLVDDFGNKLLECSSSNFTKKPPEKVN